MAVDSPNVSFASEATWRVQVAEAFARHAEGLRRLLPRARIEHVGSTAVPGSITKGDLDICVIVTASEFPEAVAHLDLGYARNTGSDWTTEFAAFASREREPVDVGVQLVVEGSSADIFVRWRELLIADGQVRSEYDRLKLRHEGGSMDAYRREKSAFIREALALPPDE
jgi:GrpB-like predicted nucleotidyltransferase (UPF0157 family)